MKDLSYLTVYCWGRLTFLSVIWFQAFLTEGMYESLSRFDKPQKSNFIWTIYSKALFICFGQTNEAYITMLQSLGLHNSVRKATENALQVKVKVLNCLLSSFLMFLFDLLYTMSKFLVFCFLVFGKRFQLLRQINLFQYWKRGLETVSNIPF